MDEIVVSTTIHLPPEEVYDFVVDFPRYSNYSKYLREVRRNGDGAPGTDYVLRFAWWKLTYTTRTRVESVDPPTRIDWRVTKDIDARGRWRIEPVNPPPSDAPDGVDTASRVFFEVEFDPDSAHAGMLDLPLFVSLDWVVDRVKPLIQREGERVVERIVEDLEGRRRPVELDIRTVDTKI